MGWFSLSWRSSLVCIAVLGVVLAVVFRILFRDKPEDHPWVNKEEVQLIEAGEAAVSSETSFKFSTQPAVLLSFSFLLLAMFTSAFADQLFVYWIPTFLLEEKGLSKEAMGIFASLPLFAGAIGGMFGGVLNDWIMRITGKKQLARKIVGFTGKLVAAIMVAVSLAFFEDGRLMMVIVAIGKFFTDWSQPTTWGAITDISGPAAGRVFGTVNMCGSIGAMLAGPILGRIVDGPGWVVLFWFIVVIYAVSSFSWLLINSSRPLVLIQDDDA